MRQWCDCAAVTRHNSVVRERREEVVERRDLPVGFNPPVFDGAIPAKPSAAKLANGFFVKPLI